MMSGVLDGTRPAPFSPRAAKTVPSACGKATSVGPLFALMVVARFEIVDGGGEV